MLPDYMRHRFYKPNMWLMYLGAWTPDVLFKASHKMIFCLYVFLKQVAIFAFMVLESIDLYLVFGDVKKMTFNFCTSTLVICVFIKIVLLVNRREKLRSLNYNLWKDSVKYNSAEDTAVLDAAYKKLNWMQKVYYAVPCTVIPVWATSSYFSYKWGPRLPPFAAYFPVDFNQDDKYVPVLIYEIFIAFYVVQTVFESDLAMLSILLQIQAHLKILSRNLVQLGRAVVEDESDLGKNGCQEEINKHLRDEGILKNLKEIVKRHLELLQYCEDLEYVFNRCMVIQLFGGSFVILVNGMETAKHMNEPNYLLINQIAYLTFLVVDIYIICYYFTTLATECTNLGEAAYGSKWYKMDAKVKRMIWTIIIRTQKAPKFTYGKLFVIDVNAFMHLIKNIYSWLMLLRQLEMK